MTNEIDLLLPSSEEAWRATSAQSWASRHKESAVSLKACLSELLKPDGANTNLKKNSVFGSYILISAMLQTIFFRRQLSLEPSLTDVTAERAALQKWLHLYSNDQEEDHQNWHAPSSPLTFNGSALLRLAYIRLNCNFGPALIQLTSNDASQVAEAILQLPAVEVNSETLRAADHARKGLSLLLRVGAPLAAKTQGQFNASFRW